MISLNYFKMLLSSSVGPDVDHTTQTANGFYMYTEVSNKEEGDKARLISARHTATIEVCVVFWYKYLSLPTVFK